MTEQELFETRTVAKKPGNGGLRKHPAVKQRKEKAEWSEKKEIKGSRKRKGGQTDGEWRYPSYQGKPNLRESTKKISKKRKKYLAERKETKSERERLT